MYVTRPLSMYQKDPSALSLPPPEGPNSGILVIQDEESDPIRCFGFYKSHEVSDLPFPQNKKLELRYTTGAGTSWPDNIRVHYDPVVFIPVLDQPLSSNRYYAIKSSGKHKGDAFINSKDQEEMVTCCFHTFVDDIEPQPSDPRDIYQQFEIHQRNWGSGFVAASVAPDGVPPKILREKGWRLRSSTHHNFKLGDAPGLDSTLRAHLPDLNFPLSYKSSPPVVVGKWYCPFVFVKEVRMNPLLQRSMYYEMTLEQKWDQIFACENEHNEDNAVAVDTVVQREVIAVAGKEFAHNEINVVDGVMRFEGGEVTVNLSLAIVERMKWEQERFGWIGGKERQVRVKRVEEFGGIGEWRKYGCYVLVERFVLKRMDGSLILTFDFKHTHQIRSKWE